MVRLEQTPATAMAITAVLAVERSNIRRKRSELGRKNRENDVKGTTLIMTVCPRLLLAEQGSTEDAVSLENEITAKRRGKEQSEVEVKRAADNQGELVPIRWGV